MLLIPVFVFIFGTIIGSFLNVVIYRLNTGRSVVTGRSRCAVCNRALHWHELVPVWSFIFLGGKCRTCKTGISFQYPFVELITGILFTLLYTTVLLPAHFSGISFVQAGFAAIIMTLAVIIVTYDFKHKIIPTVPMRLVLLLSFLAIVVQFLLNHDFPILTALLAGVEVAAPFFLLWALSRGKWMGFGDVKIGLAIGWLLGASAGFAALLVSFWAGGLIGLFLLALTHKYGMKSQIPFAPFLAFGALFVYFTGVTILTLFPLW